MHPDLSPSEARARFGDLLDRATRTHRHFEAPEGDWRPVLGSDMTLDCYRLYAPSRVPHLNAPYRRK